MPDPPAAHLQHPARTFGQASWPAVSRPRPPRRSSTVPVSSPWLHSTASAAAGSTSRASNASGSPSTPRPRRARPGDRAAGPAARRSAHSAPRGCSGSARPDRDGAGRAGRGPPAGRNPTAAAACQDRSRRACRRRGRAAPGMASSLHRARDVQATQWLDQRTSAPQPRRRSAPCSCTLPIPGRCCNAPSRARLSVRRWMSPWSGADPQDQPAAVSLPAWRILKASMSWEKPRNNAKKPTQNKIR
jgi:hypothetical protein